MIHVLHYRIPDVDPESIHIWESILHLADKFVMDEVKAVALHALGRKGALGDAHKLALCVRYNIDKAWAEELEILPPKMAGAVSRAREGLLRRSAQKMTVRSSVQAYSKSGSHSCRYLLQPSCGKLYVRTI